MNSGTGRIYLAFGVAGSGKSDFALGCGDAEDPDDLVDFFEWESGGFRRGSARARHPERITVHKFRTPLTNIEDLTFGTIAVGQSGTAPAPSYKLDGWLLEYGNFVRAYLQAIKGTGRPVIDTATRLWLCVRQSFLEQLQEATGNEQARLDQLRYTEPNARMTQICEAPERFGKDLVLIAHEDTVFGTSQVKPDTFKEIPNMADVTLRFRVQDNRPVATIFKLGEGGMDLLGKDIVEPSLAKVNTILDNAAKLRSMKLSLPEDLEELVGVTL